MADDPRGWPERNAGWVLSGAAAALFAAGIVLGATDRAAVAVALIGGALILLLAGVFASRVVRASRAGVDLIPLHEFLRATDQLERDVQTQDEKRTLELVREMVLSLRQPTAEDAVSSAQDAIRREESVEEILVGALGGAGWDVELQPTIAHRRKPDLMATRGKDILIIEVKAGRNSLTPGVVEQLESYVADVRQSARDRNVIGALALVAGPGRPTRVERQLEDGGFRILRVNPETRNVTGLNELEA
jgi:hypothetical protein